MPITTCTHKDGNHEHCLSFEENGYTFNKLCSFKSCNMITVLPHRSHKRLVPSGRGAAL